MAGKNRAKNSVFIDKTGEILATASAIKTVNDALTSHLADVAISVKGFGAKGDGVTDDTVAIQNAVDHVASKGGGTIYFPKGEYLISDTIEITGDNITVIGEGYGSHIRTMGDVTAFVASGHDNLIWSKLRLSGIRTDNSYDGYGSGIRVSNANKILVENCFFENFMAKAVFFAGYHGSYGGNLPQGVHDGWVLNNHIDWCGDGIMVYNDGRRVEISGNMIFRCVNIGIYIDDSHRTDGTEIPRPSTRINVENNYIENMYGTTGINLAGTQYSAARGNYILFGGQEVSRNTNGISVQTVQNHVESKHNIIEGNTIVGNTNIAIDLIGASFNIIRGNNLVNNSLNRPSGGVSAINLRSNTIRDVTFGSNQNIIEYNKSYVDSEDSTTNAHIRVRDADCVGNIIRFNKCDGGAYSEPTFDEGTDTIQFQNMFNGEIFHQGFLDGSQAAPSIHFVSDPTTGFYKVQDGDIGVALNGTMAVRFRSNMLLRDGYDVQLGTSAGTRFGTSQTQKIGFWGATPVAQPQNIPQTTEATLQELEQEVNKLKQLLRNIGLMSSQ